MQNLLKVTKLDAGTVLFEKADENVSDMMRCIEKHFAWRAVQEGKTLSLSGDDTITLFCDRTWLMEAVSNLVKNAFDHTRKGCTIRIEWRTFASIVQIVVLDDGVCDGVGTHEQLLESSQVYRDIFASQYGREALAQALCGKEAL